MEITWNPISWDFTEMGRWELAATGAMATGFGHGDGVEGDGEFFWGKDLAFLANLADGFACFGAFFGDFGGLIVADDRGEGSDHGHGVFHEFGAAWEIGFDAIDAFFAEDIGDIGEESEGFEDGVREDGHHHIKFEISVGGGPGDGGVVADDFGADLHDAFTDYGVDLSWHDGATWLGFWESDFADSAAWSTTEPTEIIGDFEEGNGDGFELAAGLDEAVFGGLGFEVVAGFVEGDPGLAPEVAHDDRGEIGVTIEAGADGGATEGEFFDGGDGVGGTEAGVFDLFGVAAEFLAEADGGGVHEVGATDFDDIPEFEGLFFEGAVEEFEGWEEEFADSFGDGDVDGGGDDIVTGLAHVDMVVGVDGNFRADRLSGELRATVGDDLVDIHVGGGA